MRVHFREGFAGLLCLAAVLAAASSNATNSKTQGECAWDGKHDVSACIQAAVDSAARTDGVATIPRGDWPLARPIELPSKVTLKGEADATTLRPTEGNQSRPLLLAVKKKRKIWVEQLTFDGGGSDFPDAYPLIVVSGSEDIRFDHITVQNSHGIGLIMEAGMSRSGVTNSRFKNIGNYWKLTHSPKDRRQGLVFCCGAENQANFAENNEFENIGLDALQFSDQDRFVARRNTFNLENNSHTLLRAPDFPSAIFPMRSVNSLIEDNTIRGAQGCGIDAPGLRDSLIKKNTITGSQGCGIGLFLGYDRQTQCENVTLTQNVIVNNVLWAASPFKGGVTISNGSPRTIHLSANRITDTQSTKTQQFGVQVLRGTRLSNLVVDEDNKLSGNAMDAIRRDDK